MRYLLLLALAACMSCAPAGPAGAGPDFSSHWHDGRAELDGYRLTIGRYGAPRAGEAVMIFVTEPFSRSARVKLENPAAHPGDAVDVLKLNLVRDFPTGIYDYNTMVSVFVRSEDFAPLKVSMSSAEWCGHVYTEWIVNDHAIDETRHSYFEGESGARTIPREDGLLEDELYVRLRGLRGAFLEAGASLETRILTGPLMSRMRHQPGEWQPARIRRSNSPRPVTVPAGTFEADVYEVQLPGRTGRFHIEREYPHRILRWSWQSGPADGPAEFLGGDETGELTGSARLPYWRLNGPDGGRYRADLGLPAREVR